MSHSTLEEQFKQLSVNLEDLKAQEQQLTIPRFDPDVAFTIGQNALKVARESFAGRAAVIDIRTPSGAIYFRAVHNYANPDNESWIKKKVNTVLRFETSSLKFGQQLLAKGRGLASRDLDPADYTICGGGFPLRVPSVPDVAVAVLTVSGLTDSEDHYVAVKAISESLKEL